MIIEKVCRKTGLGRGSGTCGVLEEGKDLVNLSNRIVWRENKG
jgi:hypothetical protein